MIQAKKKKKKSKDVTIILALFNLFHARGSLQFSRGAEVKY